MGHYSGKVQGLFSIHCLMESKILVKLLLLKHLNDLLQNGEFAYKVRGNQEEMMKFSHH